MKNAVDYSCNDLGAVMKQSPAAGINALYGSMVEITVGTRPPICR